MLNWKIPLWTAGTGVVLCVASLGYTLLRDWNVHLYNPALERVIFCLSPALVLQIATADAPVLDGANQRLIYELWVVAGVFNALLYGLVGLGLAMVLRLFHAHHSSAVISQTSEGRRPET